MPGKIHERSYFQVVGKIREKIPEALSSHSDAQNFGAFLQTYLNSSKNHELEGSQTRDMSLCIPCCHWNSVCCISDEKVDTLCGFHRPLLCCMLLYHVVVCSSHHQRVCAGRIAMGICMMTRTAASASPRVTQNIQVSKNKQTNKQHSNKAFCLMRKSKQGLSPHSMEVAMTRDPVNACRREGYAMKRGTCNSIQAWSVYHFDRSKLKLLGHWTKWPDRHGVPTRPSTHRPQSL
jgi:hypothetical protein